MIKILTGIIFSLALFSCSVNKNLTSSELRQEAFNFYNQNNYKKCLKYYEHLISTKPEASYTDYYNAACCSSLSNKIKSSKTFLNTAIIKGYKNEYHLVNDIDFENLKKDEKEWNKIIKHIRDSLSYVKPLNLVYSSIPNFEATENQLDVLLQNGAFLMSSPSPEFGSQTSPYNDIFKDLLTEIEYRNKNMVKGVFASKGVEDFEAIGNYIENNSPVISIETKSIGTIARNGWRVEVFLIGVYDRGKLIHTLEAPAKDLKSPVFYSSQSIAELTGSIQEKVLSLIRRKK